MAKKKAYESKAVTTKIVATSRVAIRIKDNYYTVEAQEERNITDPKNVDMDKEWFLLFDSVNNVVDNQVTDIIATFETKDDKKKGKKKA